MELLTLWMGIGFLFAAYSVIANDSVQTLGTWIASNNERFNWKTMWVAASSVLLWAYGTVGTPMEEISPTVDSIRFPFKKFSGITR